MENRTIEQEFEYFFEKRRRINERKEQRKKMCGTPEHFFEIKRRVLGNDKRVLREKGYSVFYNPLKVYFWKIKEMILICVRRFKD